MKEGNDTNFRYLNRGGEWPSFKMRGLDRDSEGALRLCSVPRLVKEQTCGDHEGTPAPGIAGITLDPQGNVYFCEPARHRIMRIVTGFWVRRSVK